MTMMADLFDVPLVPGLATRAENVSAEEEASLIAKIDAEGLSPVRFQQWTGKRLSGSFGWSYDFETGRFAPTDPLPNWLGPVQARAASIARHRRAPPLRHRAMRNPHRASLPPARSRRTSRTSRALSGYKLVPRRRRLRPAGGSRHISSRGASATLSEPYRLAWPAVWRGRVVASLQTQQRRALASCLREMRS
jgi:hypothetical protein